MSIAVDVVDETDLGVPTEGVTDLVRAVLELEGAQGTVVVALVSEEDIRQLNVRDRGLAYPTDVLSYCVRDEDGDWPTLMQEGEAPPELGEVVLCPAVILRYAIEGGREPGGQLAWTIIHGVLHVLGYDHEDEEEPMRRREQALLEELRPLTTALRLPVDA